MRIRSSGRTDTLKNPGSRHRVVSRDSLDGGGQSDRYVDSAAAFRGLPGDLIVGFLYTVVVAPLIVLGGLPATVQFVLGIPLLLFLPGYAVLAALFPGRPSRNAGRVSSLSGMSRRFESMRSIQRRGVRWGERAALSFGLSLFAVPLLALALGFLPILFGTGSPYRTAPIVGILAVVTLAGMVVGFVRRLRLPRAERFAAPAGYWARDFADGLTDSPADALLNVVLVLSILVATVALTYTFATPQEAEAPTMFRVGAFNDSDQLDFDYPTNLTEGEEQQYVVSVENEEQVAANYSVVVQLQNRNGSEVLSRDQLTQFSSPTVPANRTWQNPHQITPTTSGENLQLVYLLYEGEPPGDPTAENAYRTAHLSVDVAPANESAGGG